MRREMAFLVFYFTAQVAQRVEFSFDCPQIVLIVRGDREKISILNGTLKLKVCINETLLLQNEFQILQKVKV